MDINAFIEKLKRKKDIRNIVHHEVIEPVAASFGEFRRPLDAPVRGALSGIGIDRLYTHQVRGIELVKAGRNVVAMTPTASGKSLIYNVPVIESILKDPGTHALYIFPLKGLEQDQQGAFTELARPLPLPGADDDESTKGSHPGPSAIYDGDTTGYRRKKIREQPPPVVLTNPDMLHLAINAFHQKWEAFFRGLKFVIIDEIHTYRGVLGSHVSQVLRRLRRVSEKYGAKPRFIASSATIANPLELARMLTGLEFELVDESGAPRGKRNFIFINPVPDLSPYTVATRLFTESVRAGFKTIAFTRSRKITELMYSWVVEGAPELADTISSYRAGFLPEERRTIEKRLFNDELSGVITTSALELGVDIGGLDVCILVGYPGSISSTWQRAGRVGRTGRDSLIIMVAIEDALDQYFMRNPADFFKRSVEAAVLDNSNESVLKAHLPCAVAELPMKSDEAVYERAAIDPILGILEDEGKVRYWQKGDMWYPRRRYPHREVSIRQTGAKFTIFDEDGTLVGEAGSASVMRELHPGAVYLHRGSQYVVKSLNLGTKEVRLRSAAESLGYYTSAIAEEETEIISTLETKRVKNFSISTGKLKITESILGYRKKDLHTRRLLGEHLLELPPQVFGTTGIWLEVSEEILGEVDGATWSVAGALHALEHSMIAALPLYALCDRMDLGGVSYTLNPELESAAVFIYDAHEGGVGITRRGFDVVEKWFTSTLVLMEECACEVSCPSCTQDPRCGNNNEPLDKRGAILILKRWLGWE